MGNRKSLGRAIAKYSFLELFYSFFIIVLSFLLFNKLVSSGIVLASNHAEKTLYSIEQDFDKANWSVSDLPFYYEYNIIELGTLRNTIPREQQDKVVEAYQYGDSSIPGFFSSTVFKSYKNEYRTMVISYRIGTAINSEKWFGYIKNFGLVYGTVFLTIWIGGILGMIHKCKREIQKELDKVNSVNHQIKDMNLNYTRVTSKYSEINDLLESLDVLSNDLDASLKKQWDVQKKQKELVESVTHDIRTPLTLIKGNLELLKEELPSSNLDTFSDLENGVQRLESYILKLKAISYEDEQDHMQPMTKEVIDEFVLSLSSLCSQQNRKLIVKNKEVANVYIKKQGILNVLENIINNSVEHSNSSSNIFLSFDVQGSQYEISVEDEGHGFSEEALGNATIKHFTTKKDELGVHGLGLAFAKEVLSQHQGKLEVRNTSNGACVVLELPINLKSDNS